MSDNIIRNVITRTSGELYLGVVGSVRSGKSTFIRRFMELKVLPFVNDKDSYKRVLDELPQSGEGRNIMTVEPKFIPADGVEIKRPYGIFLSILHLLLLYFSLRCYLVLLIELITPTHS